MNESLPVAVIGAGPVGLAAAAHLLATGQEPIVFEAGEGPGTSIAEWGHVRLFSPWAMTVDQEAAKLLTAHGWQTPDPNEYPTGRQLIDRYLAPLAALDVIDERIRYGNRVVSVTRLGLDKLKTPERENTPFRLRVATLEGERDLIVRAVIDASGTWSQPNPAGAAGVPALGERDVADRISYRIPDVLGADRARYAGQRVLVVGSGHSAFNVLGDLVALRKTDAAPTKIIWAIRRTQLGDVFGGGEKDALVERGRLGRRIRGLIDEGAISVRFGTRIERFDRSADGGVIVISDGEKIADVDEVVVVTGFRPDQRLLGELRLDLDPALESPAKLAPLIDPNVHSCGTVPPHGVDELRHPAEPDVYIVGMKAYGRAPTALMITGYEQVRSVVAALAGDWESARDVRLVLPETGVCTLSGGSSVDASAQAACGTTSEATELSGCG